jgi:hypothetical protein
MADKVVSPTEIIKKLSLKTCWRRFKQSRKVHKKRYFLATCLIKLGAFIGFMVVSGQKFDEFMKRPEYIPVCQYAVSEELELYVDYPSCAITVNQKLFTCDTEYGSNPTGVTYDQYYKGSEYSSVETAESGYNTANTEETAYNTGDTGDSGYNSSYTGDSGYNSSYTGDLGYNNSDTGNSSIDTGNAGSSGYNSSYIGESGYNNSYTEGTGNNLNSSSSTDENIPTSGPNRRALASSRSLQSSDYTTQLYSDEAYDAKEFANDILKGYLVFLYILWVTFNFAFRVHSNLYTYRSRILQSIPRYSKTKKLKISIYENLIDMCVATALYPFTYPEYGDCFECPISFMCSIAMYAFVNIGFYIVLISILLIMFEKTRVQYITFLKSSLVYVMCRPEERTTNTQCVVRCLVCFLVICINLFALAACIVVVIDYISTVYSVIQLCISIIFYFALFCDGDVREGQVAPEEQHAFTQGNDDQYRGNFNGQGDQRSHNNPTHGNNLRRKQLKGVLKVAKLCLKCGSSEE